MKLLSKIKGLFRRKKPPIPVKLPKIDVTELKRKEIVKARKALERERKEFLREDVFTEMKGKEFEERKKIFREFIADTGENIEEVRVWYSEEKGEIETKAKKTVYEKRKEILINTFEDLSSEQKKEILKELSKRRY